MAAFHSFAFLSLGLPLLARELTEMANRWRTYLLRVAYALLLFVLAYMQFYDILRAGNDRFAMLGQGKRMFETLLTLQFAGIYLFMPVVGCSAFTYEKERNSLGLLLLTKLGPTTILFEKLLSRLVPMFVFLLLAMPLLAFAYSLGGVTEFVLAANIIIVALTAVQLAALTLACSAFCHTTIAAFVASYALSFVSFFFCSCCGLNFLPYDGGMAIEGIAEFVFRFVLLGAWTCAFLLFGRRFLVERAFTAPDYDGDPALSRFDRVSIESDRATGGKTLIRTGPSLPEDRPIAWRELSKLSGRWLLGIGVAVQVQLLFLLILAIGVGSSTEMLRYLEMLLWFVTVGLLVIVTTGAICRERGRQTLDILLATPLTGREILSQKLAAVWKIAVLLWIPFGTILLTRTLIWIKDDLSVVAGTRLLIGGVAVLVYAPLVVWLTLGISLRLRSQSRAILLSLGLIGSWVLLPLLSPAMQYFNETRPMQQFSWLVLSPAGIFHSRFAGSRQGLLVVLAHAGLYAALLAAIRYFVLTRADALLGRPGDAAETAPVSSAIVPQPVAEAVEP